MTNKDINKIFNYRIKKYTAFAESTRKDSDKYQKLVNELIQIKAELIKELK